jgi:hypothetical protein
VLAFHHQLPVLVVDGDAHHEHPRGAAGLDGGEGEHGGEGIAGIDRLEESRRLLEKGDEGVAHHVREEAGTRRALGRHHEAMGEEIRVTGSS